MISFRHGFKGFEAAKEAGRCIENYIAYVNKQTEASLKNQEWLNNSLKDAFQNAQNTLIQIETSSKQMVLKLTANDTKYSQHAF